MSTLSAFAEALRVRGEGVQDVILDTIRVSEHPLRREYTRKSVTLYIPEKGPCLVYARLVDGVWVADITR